MLAQSAEAIKLIHCQASLGCLVPDQIADDRPLIGEKRPFGPVGSKAKPTLNVACDTTEPMSHDPIGNMAAFPARNRLSTPLLNWSLFGANPLTKCWSDHHWTVAMTSGSS